jgi:DNA-directed RNA polymerase specialized sigma24 family protein
MSPYKQKPGESTDERQMQAYLYAIATRLNLDRWKHTKVKEKWLPHFFRHRQGEVEHIEERIGLQADVAQIFQDLNPQERALLWLAYVEEQPHRSIAEIKPFVVLFSKLCPGTTSRFPRQKMGAVRHPGRSRIFF